MSAGVGSVMTEVIPFGLVVALSPLSIIPAVMMFSTPKPRPTSLAYLAGWLAGLAVLTVVFIQLAGLIGGHGDGPHKHWVTWVRIIAGAALIAFGLYKWLTRTKSEHTPGWMTALSSASPPRALVTAAVLTVVNPKVLFMVLAAGADISTAGLKGADAWTAGLWFVLVAASTVIIPVLAYAVSGDRLDQPLARLKTWMEEQHAALIAGILIILGLMVLYKGLHGL